MSEILQPGERVELNRVAVDGTAISIATLEAAAAPPPPAPEPVAPLFPVGVVVGSAIAWELRFVQILRAPVARMEFGIGTPADQLADEIDAYAKAGVRAHLLASFRGRIPTDTEAKSLASWAKAYGPGGTFWQGKTYPPEVAVRNIEFGNETSYSYQWSDNSATTYASRAKAYAQKFATADAAIATVNDRVGLLAIGDGMNTAAWITNMASAVPDIGARTCAFSVHPYGPRWQQRMAETVAALEAVGVQEGRLLVTEWGLSTDNGRALSDNYGWNKAMTYDEAAAVLRGVLAQMRLVYGSRLGAFFLYQAHDQYASGTQTGREAYFGGVKLDGTAKGAYTGAVLEAIALGKTAA